MSNANDTRKLLPIGTVEEFERLTGSRGSVHFGPAPARKRPETSPTSPNDRERQVDHRGDD
ncbi:MAG TPA: hypothetical protein VFP60_19180 [Pseudolabrys sp.]|nr:hypothetical protein [Pseudolabrys sp.]